MDITNTINIIISFIEKVLGFLPVKELALTLLGLILLIYFLAEKVKETLFFIAAQLVLWNSARGTLSELIAASPQYSKLSEQIIGKTGEFSIGDLNLFMYMDRIMSFASYLPKTTLKYWDLTSPIIVSFVFVLIYIMFIMKDEFEKQNKGEFLPIFSLLLTLAMFGGGLGFWRFSSSISFWNIPLSYIILVIVLLYCLVVGYYDFWLPAEKGLERSSMSGSKEKRGNERA